MIKVNLQNSIISGHIYLPSPNHAERRSEQLVRGCPSNKTQFFASYEALLLIKFTASSSTPEQHKCLARFGKL